MPNNVKKDTPKQGALSVAHQQFIDAVINGTKPTDAYMQVFPGSSRTAAHSSSSRLMAQPQIWQRVIDGKLAARQRTQQRLRQDITSNLQRIELRLRILEDVINGNWQRTDTLTKDNGAVTQRHRSDPMVLLRAISLEQQLAAERTRLITELAQLDDIIQDNGEEPASIPDELRRERITYIRGDIMSINLYKDPIPNILKQWLDKRTPPKNLSKT